MHFELRCCRCDEGRVEHGAYQCPSCGGRLEVVYPDLTGCFEEVFGQGRSGGNGIWRFRRLLPLTENTPVVTLGEGGTPLHECSGLRDQLGIARLVIKNETLNPSGTFKDRCAAIAVAKALEFGASAAVLASAGNAGASAAAYAARAGLSLFVFIPKHTPRERITQILLYGATAIATGASVNEAVALIDQVRDRLGWHVLTTAAAYNPYQGEGPKTIGYEMAEQLEFRLPDWVIVPVGGGGILSALWKSFKEMRQAGVTERLPRMVGVQAAGCAPLVRAYDEGIAADAIPSWGTVTTLAASIADPFPIDGETALTAIRESGGTAVAIEDSEILQAQIDLARHEGIFAEPASCSTLAALRRLLMGGAIQRAQTVALIATGVGFKDMTSAEKAAPPALEIDCNVGALERAIGAPSTPRKKTTPS